MRNATTMFLALATAGVIGAGAAIAVQQSQAFASPHPVATATAPANAAQGAPAPVPAPMISLPDFSVIATRNGPAVVNISTVGSTKEANFRGDADAENDPFYEFFRRFQSPASVAAAARRPRPTASAPASSSAPMALS